MGKKTKRDKSLPRHGDRGGGERIYSLVLNLILGVLEEINRYRILGTAGMGSRR